MSELRTLRDVILAKLDSSGGLSLTKDETVSMLAWIALLDQQADVDAAAFARIREEVSALMPKHKPNGAP